MIYHIHSSKTSFSLFPCDVESYNFYMVSHRPILRDLSCYYFIGSSPKSETPLKLETLFSCQLFTHLAFSFFEFEQVYCVLKLSTVVSPICLVLKLSSPVSSHVQILSSALSSFLLCSYFFLTCHFSGVFKLSSIVFSFWLFRISKTRFVIGFVSLVVLHQFCFSCCLILVSSHLGFDTSIVLVVAWLQFCLGGCLAPLSLLQFFVSFFTGFVSIAVWHFSFFNLVLTVVPNVPGPDNLKHQTILFGYFSLSKGAR